MKGLRAVDQTGVAMLLEALEDAQGALDARRGKPVELRMANAPPELVAAVRTFPPGGLAQVGPTPADSTAKHGNVG